MKDLPLGIIAALVPEFAVKDLPLGRTLLIYIYIYTVRVAHSVTEILLQPGGSEATRLAPSKPGGRRSVHGR